MNIQLFYIIFHMSIVSIKVYMGRYTKIRTYQGILGLPVLYGCRL